MPGYQLSCSSVRGWRGRGANGVISWRRWADGVWIWWLVLLIGIASGWMLNILTSGPRHRRLRLS